MFNIEDITVLETPEVVRTASGTTKLPAVWTGVMDLNGASFQGTLYLAPDYVGGVIFGDDLLDALAVRMSTSNGYRDIHFTNLGVGARIDLKTHQGYYVPHDSCSTLVTLRQTNNTDLIAKPIDSLSTIDKVPQVTLESFTDSLSLVGGNSKETAELKLDLPLQHVSLPDKDAGETPLCLGSPVILDSGIGGSDVKKSSFGLRQVPPKTLYPTIGPKWYRLLKNLWDFAVLQHPVLSMPEGQGPMVTEIARIPVNPGPPVMVPNYRSALVEKDFIKNKVSDLLKKGIIKRTKSDWNSPILVVPKVGDEKFRLVVDYRRLNKRIAGDSYPLPHIEDLLTKTAEA